MLDNRLHLIRWCNKCLACFSTLMHLIQVAQPLLGIRSDSRVHLLKVFSRLVNVN